jgi:carotenoid cleavage dioxygenase-like enzyme
MQFNRKSSYCLFSISSQSKKRNLLAKIPVTQPSYMHSFSLTDSFAILTEYPYTINPLDLLLKRKPFIQNFKWHPKSGTRFLVIDRKKGDLKTFDTDSFFAFHHINAFEKNHKLYPDCYAGEPIFIPDPNFQKEDDGVILSVILDAENRGSFLLALNACDFSEIARSKIPHAIPFGLHGRFFPEV